MGSHRNQHFNHRDRHIFVAQVPRSQRPPAAKYVLEPRATFHIAHVRDVFRNLDAIVEEGYKHLSRIATR